MGLCHSSCRTRAEGGEGKASPCSHGAAFRLFLQKQLFSTCAHTGYSQPARGRLPAGTGQGASSPLGQRVRRPRKVLTARGMSSGHSAHRGQTFQRIPVFLTAPRPAPSSSDPPRSWLGGHEERLFSDLWKRTTEACQSVLRPSRRSTSRSTRSGHHHQPPEALRPAELCSQQPNHIQSLTPGACEFISLGNRFLQMGSG